MGRDPTRRATDAGDGEMRGQAERSESDALAEFCRRAAPILAQERGLTATCRVKLAGLAHALGLDERQMAAALRRLGSPAPPPPQVQRFRKRLRKDLAGKTKTILGPTILQQILKAAREKYGLDEAIARQTLDEVVAELGLTCITPTEAMESLAAQIDQAIGQATWLAREGWDRLRSAGVAWGFELEVVDTLIEERLATNRADQARRRLWTGLTVGLSSVVAALTVTLVGLAIAYQTVRSRGVTTQAPQPSSSPLASPRPRPATSAAWWDVELAVEAVHLRSQLATWPALARSWDDLVSPQAEQRARAYEQWIAQAATLATTPDRSRVLQRLLAGCYALEPSDDAAKRLLEALKAWWPGPGQRLPSAASGWQPALWAVETAAEMLRRAADGPRAHALRQALAYHLGQEVPRPPPEELPGALAQLAVRAAYRQLTAAAAEQPSQVAALVARLRAHANRLPPSERLAADTELLVAALPTAHETWPAYQQAMIAVATAEDLQYALRLVELLRRLSSEPLYAYLSGLLADRAGLRPLPAERGQAVVALRRALGGSAALTALDRWYLLQTAVAPLLADPPPSDEASLIPQTAKVAHYGTLAAALARGEEGWLLFDATMDKPPALTARPPPAPSADGVKAVARSAPPPAPPKRASGTPHWRQQWLKAQQLRRATGPGANAQREAGWQMLAQLLAEGATIGPVEAASVARDLWTSRTPEEHARLLGWLGVLRRWPYVLLAVADQLPEQGSLDAQQREMLAVLLDRPVPAGASSGALKQQLLAHVVESIGHQIRTADAPADDDPLDELAEALTQTYRHRAALWQVPPSALSGQPTPSQVLAALAIHLGTSSASQGMPGHASQEGDLPPGRLWEARQQAIALWADNDLGCTVAWQTLLVAHAAQRIAASQPGLASPARQIVAETNIRCRAAPTRLVQLYLEETAWLRLWMLHAPPP